MKFSALRLVLLLGIAATAINGCARHQSAADHARSLPTAEDRRLTLGTVQSQVARGMTGGQVAAALGAPNIVTTGQHGGETWVYDKIATERAYSQSSGGYVGVAGGAGGGVGGFGLGGANSSAGAVGSTQRSLTVVIDYDAQGRVADVRYHSSSF